MNRILFIALFCMVMVHSLAAQQPNREDKVRNDKKTVEAAGYWIYNDIPKAIAEAKANGKPIIAVLRCLPCVECVKLDDDLIDADATIKPLLEQFTRVRVVSTNGLDLSLFQFDTDQSFAVFLFNADGTIYGRFGTRSHRTNWVGDVSVDGLAEAMKGALALHKDYASVKPSLMAKRGPAPEFASPEKFPTLKEKYKATIDYEGKVVPSCIHCHQIGDAMRDVVLSRKEKLSDAMLFPYPHPKSLGLILDPKTMATVASVTPESDASKAGFKAGDQIRSLRGQPLLSIADVQWVLHHTPAAANDLTAEIIRDGQPLNLRLSLAKDWRQRDDISWRASTWALRRAALGGVFLVDLPEEDRKKLNRGKDSTALQVQHVGQFAPHDRAYKAGVRKGDIVIGVNGSSDLLRETDVLVAMLKNRKPKENVTLTVLRNGKEQTISYALPE